MGVHLSLLVFHVSHVIPFEVNILLPSSPLFSSKKNLQKDYAEILL